MTQQTEIKISSNIEDGILACFITGERKDDTVLKIWAEIIDLCKHHKLSLVQVTMALRGKYQPFKAIEIYRAVIAQLTSIELSLAVVDLNHLSAADTQVACNMGLIKGINVSYFESQNDAKNWLLSQSKKHNDKASSTNNEQVSYADKGSGQIQHRV